MNILRGALFASVLALPVHAQETINLTVASSHPTVVPWVGMIQTHFMAKTDEILAEGGNYKSVSRWSTKRRNPMRYMLSAGDIREPHWALTRETNVSADFSGSL